LDTPSKRSIEALKAQIAELEADNAKLTKINNVLIKRVESSSSQITNPYAAFEQSVSLAEQVRERTEALNTALECLNKSNIDLSVANEKAEQANLSKTKFLAAVSHDLLQPLHAARLFAGALSETIGSSEHVSIKGSTLNSLNHSLDDVEALLRTLVDISKLDAGVVEVDKVNTSVDPILRQLTTEFSQVAKAAGLKFKHRTCKANVYTDPQLLLRILRNLLTNAIRYTNEGGILLSARKRGTKLLIQVWDTGIGIEESDLENIFDEFKRLSSPRKRFDRGLGLGLSIVEKMAGVLEHSVFVSSKPNRGSVFSIELNIIENPSIPADLERITTPILSQPKVASVIGLIDNDLTICTAMKSLLEHWGAEVYFAKNGEKLIEQISLESIDLLIVDYHLDDNINGLTVAQALTDKSNKNLPILVITANHSRELDQQVNALGYSLLHKPVKPMQLRLKIGALLK